MNKIFTLDKKIIKIFFIYVTMELISFITYFTPSIKTEIFLLISFTVLILSIIDIRFGVWLALGELFIGSKGYLFFAEFGGTIISIRMAIYLIVLSAWFSKKIKEFIKTKKTNISFLNSNLFPLFIIFFLFITWGIISGVINKNDFANIFFDVNNWLYFALILPVFDILGQRQNKEKHFAEIMRIFLAALILIGLKTICLLYIFSHNIESAREIYQWVRNTGVGEITQIKGGFYRIFIQSQIYILVGFFILYFYLLKNFIGNKTLAWKNKILDKNFLIVFLVNSLLLSTLLISGSRSFWVGLAVGLIITSIYFIFKKSWTNFLYNIISALLLAVFSMIFILATVKFPLPAPKGGFETADVLSERASQVSGEAGAASRWSLLPELGKKISAHPIIGQGFGAIVSYKSSDPRILQKNKEGIMTTYAFEWGWLDIWLKIGFIGLAVYIFLLAAIFYNGAKHYLAMKQNEVAFGLFFGLIVVGAVNTFSPYFNHPLGIGLIIITSALIQNEECEQSTRLFILLKNKAKILLLRFHKM